MSFAVLVVGLVLAANQPRSEHAPSFRCFAVAALVWLVAVLAVCATAIAAVTGGEL